MGEFDLGKSAKDAFIGSVQEVGGLIPRWIEENINGYMDSQGLESTSSRAAREFDLLHQGMAQGITQSVNEAKENPGDLVFKAGVAAVIAVPAYTVLPRIIGAKAAYFVIETIALGGTAAVAFDGAKHVSTIGSAMKESWNNPQMYEFHKRQVASAGGPLVLDAAACYFGTAVGGRLSQPINELSYGVDRCIAQRWNRPRI